MSDAKRPVFGLMDLPSLASAEAEDAVELNIDSQGLRSSSQKVGDALFSSSSELETPPVAADWSGGGDEELSDFLDNAASDSEELDEETIQNQFQGNVDNGSGPCIYFRVVGNSALFPTRQSKYKKK